MGPGEKDRLTDWLNFLPTYGGTVLYSLLRSTDEDFLGSIAAIAASLIAFYRKT
jgi:hypothetical protein